MTKNLSIFFSQSVENQENDSDEKESDFVPVTIYLVIFLCWFINIGQFMRNAALRNFTYKRFEILWRKITNYGWQQTGSRKSPSKFSINSDRTKETSPFTLPVEPEHVSLVEQVEIIPEVFIFLPLLLQYLIWYTY